MKRINVDIKYLAGQRKVFDSTAPWKGLECGRGYGKSFLLHSNCIMDLVAGKKCLMTAQTNNILTDKFIPAMRKLAFSWGIEINWNKKHDTLSFGEGICYTASYQSDNFDDRFTGADGISSGYFDEIARCKNFDKFVACVNPTFRASNGFKPTKWFATTPVKGSRFDKWIKEQECKGGAFAVRGYTIDDNTHVTDEERAQMKDGLTGDYYRQEILGEVLDGDIEFAVFPNHIFSTIEKPRSGFCSLGIDCAGLGRDYNVFVVSDDVGIVDVIKVQVADTFKLASIARQLVSKYDVKLINIDGTGGFGQGLYDMLKIEYKFVNSINFGQRAEDDEHYANARAEMFFNLAKCIEGGFFVDDDEIREELSLISFNVNFSGKTQLVKKDTLKQVLMRSPDASDALALSMYNRKKALQQQMVTSVSADYLESIFSS